MTVRRETESMRVGHKVRRMRKPGRTRPSTKEPVVTCTCPSERHEVEAHPGYDPSGWRHHCLGGDARTTPGEIHYPGCPLHRTREQAVAEQLQRLLDLEGKSR